LKCAFGDDIDQKKVSHENDDGVIEQWPIIEAFCYVCEQTFVRGFRPFAILAPELQAVPVTPWDRRLTRNIESVKDVFRKVLHDHQKEH